MPTYRVTWEIDVEADSPREAAEKALIIQRDQNSAADVFDVRKHDTNAGALRVDLSGNPEDDFWIP